MASRSLKHLWPELSDADISSIPLKTVSFTSNQTICQEGDKSAFVYVLLEGSATLFKQSGGEKVKLVTLQPGDMVGDSLLFDDSASCNATAVADSTAVAAQISIPAFRQTMRQNSSVNDAVLRSLSKELQAFRVSLGNTKASVIDERPTMTVFDFKPHERVAFEAAVTSFGSKSPLVRYLPVKLSADTASLAANSQVVCVFVNDVANAETLTRLAALGVKCIALRCAGFNNVDLPVAHALGLDVVRVPAYSPYAVAEHAVALIMALNRKIVHAHSRVTQGNFSLHNLNGFDLHGKTVGIIGTGKIGLCLIRILVGFGCNVLCYDVFRNEEVLALPNTRYVESIDEIYAKSRIISLHCPLLPSTKYLINKESIAKMQKGVMIINTSRGPLIKTKDLIDGLKSGQVGYAGLDVYEEESAYFFEDLSAEVMTDDVLARLLTFNNVIVTSHQAFLTDEALNAIAHTTLANVSEFLGGKRGTDLTNFVA